MNFNANNANRPGIARKVKRVSDVNAMGGPPTTAPGYMVPPPVPAQTTPYGGGAAQGFDAPYVGAPDSQQYGFAGQNQYATTYQPGATNQMPQQPQSTGPGQPSGLNLPMPGAPNVPTQPGQFTVFQQPIVQDMAMQYGQHLADHGKHLIESQFEKYIPLTRLKYYFAVDNKYVINKLRLLIFPFTHTDWSLKYDQDSPVQPRYDINAPDLYIPTMAYITYVVLAGLVLGMQNRFSPEQLGILSSSALAYSIFEMIVYAITLYVANISSTLKLLDLLAYSGYKFPVIVMSILISIAFQRIGYYISLIYCSITLGVFLLRTLNNKIQQETPQSEQPTMNYDIYGNPQQQSQQNSHHTLGKKRKLYFLFLVAGLQPLLSFWLSFHLIP